MQDGDGDATFFTVSDEEFFVGTVCLVNSLRLTGNDHEIVVLDGGFSPNQRERLEPHVRLVTLPETQRSPILLKPYPHLLEPRGVVVIIDSDMIVTRSLDPILTQAAVGKVCLFTDIDNRWSSEWQETFELDRPLRRQNYLNAGFIAFSTDRHPNLLRRLWELCSKVPLAATRWGGADYESPLWNADQDVINALVMSEVDPEALMELSEDEGPCTGSLGAVRIENARTLRCNSAGFAPYLLHYWGPRKPWQRESWMRIERDAYVELMPRVLFGPDVPVPVRPSELPPWMHPGTRGAVARAMLGTMNRTVRRALGLMPPAWRERAAGAASRLLG